MTETIDWLTHGEKDTLKQLIGKEIAYLTFLLHRYMAELESGTLTARETANTNRKNIFQIQNKINLLTNILTKF